MPDQNDYIPRDQAQRPFFAGVDLGGTNIKVGLVDDLGRTLAWRKIRTETERGPDDGVRRMAETVRQVCDDARVNVDEIARVGLGSPGTMDVPAGMLLEPHNLPGWFNFPIRERLSQQCGLGVTFVNDANAAAYGEFWVGSGREHRSMVLLTLGTGVGCGIIIGDLLIEGEHSHGAECGHLIIDYNDTARLCPCGQVGHLEAYASATAVIKRTEEALAAGAKSAVTSMVSDQRPLSPLLLAQAAEAGDEFALEIILETARYLGIGIVSIAHTIDPEGVVLGGAMTFGGHQTELGRRFLARVREEINRRAFPVVAEKVLFDFATLGGDAGYIGAAGIARHAYRKAQGS